MPRACSACRRRGTVCKVHVRSGRCGECHLHGSTCDIRVTQAEWEELRSQRERLLRDIEASRKAQEAARRAMDEAFGEELRLRKEMSHLEKRAEEAIAVEDAHLYPEPREVLELPPAPPGDLALSPFTWSAVNGLDDQFWAASPSVPWVVAGENPQQVP